MEIKIRDEPEPRRRGWKRVHAIKKGSKSYHNQELNWFGACLQPNDIRKQDKVNCTIAETKTTMVDKNLSEAGTKRKEEGKQ